MRILHAIHDFLPRHRAGSEIYAFHLAGEQARRHDVSILCAEYDLLRPHGSLRWRVHDGLPVVELTNNWAFASFRDTYRSPGIDRTLAHVLRAIQPDVLHVHSLLTLSMSLPRLARERGIPTVATLHDYSLVCPSGGQRLHVADRHLCEVIDPDRCGRCFAESPLHAQMRFARLARSGRAVKVAGRLATALRRRSPRLVAVLGDAMRRSGPARIPSAEIGARLDAARQVFADVEVFVAPSASLGEDLVRQGVPAAKLVVSGNGMRSLRVAREPSADGRLRIGFVGTLAWTKGAHVLVDAVRALPPDGFELKVFGDAGAFPAYVASLRAQARGLPVRFMGTFDDAGRAGCYAGLDLLVVPSVWPENSPLVIHEAFMAGIPVVASRLGGMPELVRDGENGLLYDATSPPALAQALARLIDDRGLLRRLAQARPAVKTIEDNAREWDGIYRRVLERGRHAGVAR